MAGNTHHALDEVDGVTVVAAGTPPFFAIARLFSTGAVLGRRVAAPSGPQEARSLTLDECRRRFRRRVVYPVAGIVLGLPAVVAVVGSIGMVSRGTWPEEAGELFAVAGVMMLALLVLMALLFPVWRTEYRNRVGRFTPEAVAIRADARGLRILRDGQPALDGAWPAIALVALDARHRANQYDRNVWDLERLTLRQDGRAETIPLYLLDRGPPIARRILQSLIDAGRLRLGA